MRKIIVIDARSEFLSTLSSRCIIEDDLDFEIVSTLNDTSNLIHAINRYKPDEIYVCDNLVLSQPNWNFNCSVIGYYQNENSQQSGKLESANIQNCICYNGSIQIFVENIQKRNFNKVKDSSQSPLDNSQNPPKNGEVGAENIYERNLPEFNQGVYPYEVQQNPQVGTPNPQDRGADYTGQNQGYYSAQIPQQPMYQQMPSYQQPMYQQTPQNPPYQAPIYQAPMYQPPLYPQQPHTGYVNPNEQTLVSAAYQGNYNNFYQEPMDPSVKNPQGVVQGAYQGVGLTQSKPAQIITIHSAKGGVGKTTISSALSILLSKVDNGKEKLRVCLVDFNVDFGDICTTLNLPVDGPNMKQWQDDIVGKISAIQSNTSYVNDQARIDDIVRISESLTFSSGEIKRYLQELGNVSLKVLTAPLNLMESNNSSGYDYEIILRNLRDCGEFDFIICDTSNSIKEDATFTAIDMADKVFLINDQDVNTVNGNSTLLKILKNSVSINMDKIYIIINKIKGPREVVINVSEIEDVFSSYPCIARFMDDNQVQAGNNRGTSVAFDEFNPFTKELSQIIKFLIGGEITMSKSKKKKTLFKK